MAIFALVDVNNFYASCERVFDPKLANRPLAVLSNNDGCLIARSQEVKALGIPMGAPYHQYKPLLQHHKVVVLSSNYALYGDMSRRVMECLATFTPDQEVYSIDECFLGFDGVAHSALPALGQRIRETVGQWTGLPVCVGFGPTKTLAKVANFVAKKRTKDGVFSLCDGMVREAVLPTIPLTEVWGIGSRWAARLKPFGIETAQQLREAEATAIRQTLNVVGERIVYELRGEACLELEQVPPPKQNIMTSRSFGKVVTDKGQLLEAIADYAARAALKLRGQGSRCGGLSVFLKTNRFQKNKPQYSNSCAWSFDVATSDSREIIDAARQCLAALYRPGFAYHKCGVMLLDLVPAAEVQGHLFQASKHQHSDQLMAVVDSLNKRMGRGTVQFAAQGLERGQHRRTWGMRQQWRSPRYTTRWEELVKVRC